MATDEAVPSIRHWLEAVAFVLGNGDDLRKGTHVAYLTHLMVVAEA